MPKRKFASSPLEPDQEQRQTVYKQRQQTPGGSSSSPLNTRFLEEWLAFLLDYQHGRFEPVREPKQPEIINGKVTGSPLLGQLSNDEQDASDSFTPVFRNSDIDEATADRALRYYSRHSFLPAPRSDCEAERCSLAKEYVLDGPLQIQAMQRYATLTRALFGEQTYAICSLFDSTNQIVYARAGDSRIAHRAELPLETTLCSHAVLRRDAQPMIVQDLWTDWRFKYNPLCEQPNGARGYIGLPISLPNDRNIDFTGSSDKQIPVGVLAIITRDVTMPTLTEREYTILAQLAEGLSRELAAYRVDRRRRKEVEYRHITNDFLNRALVQSSTAISSHSKSHATTPSASSLTAFMPTLYEDEQRPTDSYADAVHCVHKAIGADVTVLLDISMIHRATDNTFGFMETSSLTDAEPGASCFPSVVGFRQTAGPPTAKSTFESFAALRAVSASLQQHAAGKNRIFYRSNLQESRLEALLGQEATAHVAVHLFSATQPHLLFLAVSFDSTVTFATEDVDLLLGMGAIAQASLLRKRLVEADRAKTTFISQVTHELRTPLHGLITQLEFMQDAAENGQFQEIASMLETASSCGVALSEIIEDVLDFGKISISSMESLQDHEQRKKEESERDLLALAEASAKTCLAKVQRQQSVLSLPHEIAEIVLKYEERDPADWIVYLDAAATQRVLFNLLTNAIKYCKTGSAANILLRLKLVFINEREMFEIVCSDKGLGMSADFLAGIFQPFRQANAFSPGAGLGLFITQSLVRRLSGTISAESQEGVGTSFTIHLPVHRREVRRIAFGLPLVQKTFTSEQQHSSRHANVVSESPDSLRKTKQLPAVAPAPIHPDLRVLVVDDNSISRSIMATIVKRLGVKHKEAGDGLEAIAEFEKFQPQLVWTDVSMPGMDGITAASRMRLKEKEMGWNSAYIVALTGLGSADDYAKKEAVLGTAALDEWQVKGQTKLHSLRDSIGKVSARLYARDIPKKRRRSSSVGV